MRGLVTKAFSRSAVAAMEPRIQDICDQLLDGIDASTPVDFIAAFAVPFPIFVIAEMIGAGNITTTDLLGNGALALLEDRDQWEKLCAQPSLVTNAVEEMLRYDSPVLLTDRIPMQDEQVGGCPIARGEWIWPPLGAANRDPAVHPDPDRFDIERADVEHLSFGGGPHLCPGAPLARLEARIAFAALTRRFPTLQLARPKEAPERKLVPGFRGLRELWVVAPQHVT